MWQTSIVTDTKSDNTYIDIFNSINGGGETIIFLMKQLSPHRKYLLLQFADLFNINSLLV